MTKIEADTTDGTTIEPLVGEITAAESAARDGGLAPMPTADRIAPHAARRLPTWSRHQREHADLPAESETVHDEHTFSHRVEAGLPR